MSMQNKLHAIQLHAILNCEGIEGPGNQWGSSIHIFIARPPGKLTSEQNGRSMKHDKLLNGKASEEKS